MEQIKRIFMDSLVCKTVKSINEFHKASVFKKVTNTLSNAARNSRIFGEIYSKKESDIYYKNSAFYRINQNTVNVIDKFIKSLSGIYLKTENNSKIVGFLKNTHHNIKSNTIMSIGILAIGFSIGYLLLNASVYNFVAVIIIITFFYPIMQCRMNLHNLFEGSILYKAFKYFWE